jgi:hypothetical protein
MKTLFLTSILVLISLMSFSQVITITYDYSETYSINGDYTGFNFTPLLVNEPLFFVSDNKTKKIIDLNVNSLFVYYDENLINTLKIKKSTLKDGVYLIVLDEVNIFTGNQLDTYQIIDLNNNKSYSCWFYFESNESWLINEKVIGLSVK